MDYIREIFRAVKITYNVRTALKFVRMKVNRFRIIKHCSIKDLSLDKVLENVTAVRQFGIITGLGLFGLANDLKSAYISKRCGDSELGRCCSDTACQLILPISLATAGLSLYGIL